MPEGPELHMASRFINDVCRGKIFTGKVMKSEVSLKNPDVNWNEIEYTISAVSRGKEVKVTLFSSTGIKSNKSKKAIKDNCQTFDILFRFGMSGTFKFEPVGNMHKHAHLNFFTDDGMVLSFVDTRRFGRWELTSDWGKNRGPCVLQEYQLFRDNVLKNLSKAVFNKPICEALLDQKYFNGIGNYLRAEILYRAGPIQPFIRARTIFEPLFEDGSGGDENKKTVVKSEKPDILALCNILPLEVINLKGSKGYEVEKGSENDYSEFAEWLQCYYNPSMNNMVDHNGRTIWFNGPCGPMVPQQSKSRKRKEKSHLDKKIENNDDNDEVVDGVDVKKSVKKNGNKRKSTAQEEVQVKKTRSGVKKLARETSKSSKVNVPADIQKNLQPKIKTRRVVNKMQDKAKKTASVKTPKKTPAKKTKGRQPSSYSDVKVNTTKPNLRQKKKK